MTYQSWNSVYSHSWFNRAFQVICRWWEQSYLFSYGDSVWRFLHSTFLHSSVRAYFQTNEIGLSRFIRQSYILSSIIRSLFSLFALLNAFYTRVMSGSMTERLIHSFHRDANTNPVRYLASFFFSGFVIWVILTLLFGSGFSKSEQGMMLLLAFLTWFLSLLDINSLEAIRKSRFYLWFCSWYTSEEADQVKP